jgi:hypothetical protein
MAGDASRAPSRIDMEKLRPGLEWCSVAFLLSSLLRLRAQKAKKQEWYSNRVVGDYNANKFFATSADSSMYLSKCGQVVIVGPSSILIGGADAREERACNMVKQLVI